MKVIKIDIDEDALHILKETKQRIRETDPDRKVNYSAAIRELTKKVNHSGLKPETLTQKRAH